MRARVTFIFLACSSLFVGEIASFQACPAYVHIGKERTYEMALKNSINKLFKRVQSGIPNLDLRLENPTILKGSYGIKFYMMSNDEINVQLNNMIVSELTNLTVTNVAVRPQNTGAIFDVLIELRIPHISNTASYHLTGTWRNESYDTTGQLNSYFNISTASIRLRAVLDDYDRHWNIMELTINHPSQDSNSDIVHFGHSVLDESDDYGMKSFRQQTTAMIVSLLVTHFETISHRFLQKLFRQVHWYAIINGEFDPEL